MQAESSDAKLLTCGVDWLTVTCVDSSNAVRMATRATNLLKSEVKRGCFRRPWGMSGFSGWMAGHVQFGRRDAELIVRLTGALASEEWRKFYALADNVSRLDVECTTVAVGDADQRIARHWSAAKRHRKLSKRASQLARFCNADGGHTIYFNSRRSERYGRVYNKGAESNLRAFENAVRYELEMKGATARMFADALSQASSTTALISSEVCSFFAARGVVPTGVVGGPKLSVLPRSRSDAGERLVWLSKAVGPTACELIRRGMDRELLKALGLTLRNGRLRIRPNEVQLRSVA